MLRKFRLTFPLLTALLLCGAPATGAETPEPAASPAVSWLTMNETERQAASTLAESYMQFIGSAKIPLRRVRALRERAEKAGFKPFSTSERWQPGARFYVVNRDCAMLLLVVGKQPLSEGIRLVGAHLDSPRLDLRVRPLKSAEGLMLLKAEPYGGIKRYQWTNLPLALVGQFARPDGTIQEVSIGEAASDPVFVLPDLAPHVDKDQRKRTADEVFRGEELNVIAASIPTLKGSLPKAFMEALNQRYKLTEEDFVSADLSLVPAQGPREVGLDGSLIGGYGQDDALCSYAAFEALTHLSGTPGRTAVAYLVDHEEVGNVNTTGVRSRFFTAALERFLAREAGQAATALQVSELLERSEALSADVSQAINPNFPGTEDAQTTARVGQGLSVKALRAGYSATPAYRARLRKLLGDQRIPWQTYAYKVDGGGGSTIGGDLQELNMDVVDVGAPLLAMHGTFELSSKADLHALRRFFGAFWGQ